MNAKTAKVEAMLDLLKGLKKKNHHVYTQLKKYVAGSANSSRFKLINLILLQEQQCLITLNQYFQQPTRMYVPRLPLQKKIMNFLKKAKKQRQILQRDGTQPQEIIQESPIEIRKYYQTIYDSNQLLEQKVSEFLQNHYEGIEQIKLDHLDFVQTGMFENYQNQGSSDNIPLKTKKSNPTKKKLDRLIFSQIKRDLPPEVYEQLIKILHLYKEAIITKYEFLDLIKQSLQPKHYAQLVDIVGQRQVSRRESSNFKCLSDLKLTDQQRVTPSYIKRPQWYPCHKSNQGDLEKEVLNNKYVIIQKGTQVFQIKQKTQHEKNLMYAQDNLYQIDIQILKIRNTIKMLQKIQGQLLTSAIIDRIKKIGILLSKNNRGEIYLKKQVETFLQTKNKADKQTIISILNQQLSYCQQIKNKNSENYQKVSKTSKQGSMKLQSNTFCKKQLKWKTSQKSQLDDRAKQLKQSLKLLKNQSDINISFYDCLSKLGSRLQAPYKQKSKSFPAIVPNIGNVLPAFIFCFEDIRSMQISYQILEVFISRKTMHINIIKSLKNIYTYFLFFSDFKRFRLQKKLTKQNIRQMINSDCENTNDLQSYFSIEADQQILQQLIPIQSKLNIIQNDAIDSSSLLPIEQQGFTISYTHSKFHTLIRLLFFLYERIVKIMQLLKLQNKSQSLFQIIFQASLTIQNINWKDAIELLLGSNAYLCTNMMNFLQEIYQQLKSLSQCQVFNYTINQSKQQQIECIKRTQFIHFITENNNKLDNMKIYRWAFQQNSRCLYMNFPFETNACKMDKLLIQANVEEDRLCQNIGLRNDQVYYQICQNENILSPAKQQEIVNPQRISRVNSQMLRRQLNKVYKSVMNIKKEQ